MVCIKCRARTDENYFCSKCVENTSIKEKMRLLREYKKKIWKNEKE